MLMVRTSQPWANGDITPSRGATMANLTGMQGYGETDRRSDAALAYAIFRFTFGLNIMMRGVVRIAIGIPAFQTYMLTQFKDIPVMPPAFLLPFASVLPFVETL